MSMNLREYLRLDFGMHLRYLLMKDKCEKCGSTENLNLHHVDRFHNMLIESLLELNVNELSDVDEYPAEILIAIRDKMISKQLRSEYKTLCEPCHRSVHSIESRTEVYKEFTYNPYGSYFFVNLESLSCVDGQIAFKFLYLCCFVGYTNKLTYGNRKKGFDGMILDDLEEVLNISTRTVEKVKSSLIDNKLIELDEQGFISINKNIMYKGFRPNGNAKYTRFFSDFILQLYPKLDPRKHKTIFRAFSLFNHLSNFNWISENDKPINATKICSILGYAYGRGNESNLKIFIDNKIIICKKNSYFINPAFMYNGYLSEKLKDIEKFMVS